MSSHSSQLTPDAGHHWGLWDAISLIVGIVIGTAIFRSPPLVVQQLPNIAGSLLVWFVGGLLMLMGALCYAELTTAFRRPGADYHFLTLAYGPRVAFLFGWAQLTVILTASMGTMAYTFADYAARLAPILAPRTYEVALAALLSLAAIHMTSTHSGRWAQNALTTAKILGLAGIPIAALMTLGAPALAAELGAEAPGAIDADAAGGLAPLWRRVGLALIFVLYAYGGWNDAAMVASEVRQPQRNLPRALCGGLAAIIGIYLIINAAYLYVLGVEGASATTTPAADVLAIGFQRLGWSQSAERVMCVMVMISALGAVNGMLVAGSRLFSVWGADNWGPAAENGERRVDLPRLRKRALWIQTAVAAGLIWIVGSRAGRATIDASLATLHLPQLQWARFGGGFDLLLAAAAPTFWTFLLMTTTTVIALRLRAADHPRPFRVPGYPWPVVLFAATCVYMIYSALDYARGLALLGVAPLVPGLCWVLTPQFSRRVAARRTSAQ